MDEAFIFIGIFQEIDDRYHDVDDEDWEEQKKTFVSSTKLELVSVVPPSSPPLGTPLFSGAFANFLWCFFCRQCGSLLAPHARLRSFPLSSQFSLRCRAGHSPIRSPASCFHEFRPPCFLSLDLRKILFLFLLLQQNPFSC